MFRPRTDPNPPTALSEVVDGEIVAEGPNLDRLLAEVGDAFGAQVEILDAQRSIVGGIAGFFGREWFTVTARVTDPSTPDPHTPELGADATVPGGVPAPSWEDGAGAAVDGQSFAAALAQALADVDELVDAVRSEGPHAATTGVESEPKLPTVDPRPATDVLAITAPELDDDELAARLHELVRIAPLVPRRGIVAVVGDAAAALDAAETTARLAGMDPADVLVASAVPVPTRAAWLRITDPADAARRRGRWSSAKRLTIVAVSLQPGLEGLDWTRAVLAALDADQVHLAVPGWRRADEVLPRLRGLGRVDAIDLCDPLEPANLVEFLGLPVPVATLAGVRAGVEAWAARLRPPTAHAADAPTEVVAEPPADGERTWTEPHWEVLR